MESIGHFVPFLWRVTIPTCLRLLALSVLSFPALADDWLPITPEELKMTGEPKAPGAAAVYLYRQVDRRDTSSDESLYFRVKILTPEGRKYGDVEIPFTKGVESVYGIQARTIRPDGSIVKFDGTVYDKPIISAAGVKVLAKTFSMPDVEVGSIIEYRYHHSQSSGYVFDSHWILSQNIFTRYAKFSLEPSPYFGLVWSWPRGLPPGTDLPKKDRDKIRLETHDVPAFVTEEFMPPENELRYRVDFIYMNDAHVEKDPAEFWKRHGKEGYKSVDDFIHNRKAMEQAVAQIVSPGDSPETKLRKIYARTQQIRNTSFEREKSEQEVKREKQGAPRYADDVWKLGYGDGVQITWLFLALTRAAGIPADPVLVPTRDRYFFDPRVMNPAQLNSSLVVVNIDGKDFFLDPGTPFTPFGLLPWYETQVRGLRLNKDGGSWINTPLPQPGDSRIERRATLKLDPSGALKGKATLTFSGLEAAWRRMDERNEDETDRKHFLENQIQGDIPTGINATLTNQPDWGGYDPPLVAEFDLEVPGWATPAGQRQLLPAALFANPEKHEFDHASRVQPLYFSFPYQHNDDVTIDMSAGLRVNEVPKPRIVDLKVVAYKSAVQNTDGSSLHSQREISLNMVLVDPKYYEQLRNFFQTVRTGDEEQIVVSRSKP